MGVCLIILKDIPDDSIGAFITDPPYEINFMSKTRDKTGISHNIDLWHKLLRILKPGTIFDERWNQIIFSPGYKPL
jgi:DNA modification methylase